MNFLQSVILLIATLAAIFSFWGWLRAAKAKEEEDASPRLALLQEKVDSFPKLVREEAAAARREAGEQAVSLRQEMATQIANLRTGLENSFTGLATSSNERMTAFSDSAKASSDNLGRMQADRLGETNLSMKQLAERLETQQRDANKTLSEALDRLNQSLKQNQQETNKLSTETMDKVRETLGQSLEALRKDNETKLEAMRATVEEKLQGTLDQRLGENFKQVSDRLEQVHKGLGEMQTLATGVGDLKRVLTNVKSRGSWGEVQLGALLDDLLTPEQFARQHRIRPESPEVVDFVIRLPETVLPIDCKYPQSDYEALLAAQEAGDAALAEVTGKAFERAVRLQARSISEKYIHPPLTTNFAVLYLPTEGLFAEVVRRSAFVHELQSSTRVTVAGPTTIAALLNSFRMGFTTLEIQKKSSEIGVILGQTKTAFEKYGSALDAVDRKLDEAKKKVADVGVRHREITRRLRGVEAVAESVGSTAPPLLTVLADDEEAIEAAE